LTYENSTLGIRFEYPIDWKYYLQTTSNVTAYPSINEVRFRLLIASLTISVRDLPVYLQNISIQQLSKLVMSAFDIINPYLKVLSSENSILSGYPAQKIAITYSEPSRPKAIETDILTIKNSVVYSILFASHATYYNTFFPTAQKVIDSFKVTK
jgi:hypothetical protein